MLCAGKCPGAAPGNHSGPHRPSVQKHRRRVRTPQDDPLANPGRLIAVRHCRVYSP
jgi:hypothetical protein